jgi:antitoxin component YwqK of YwqJK toxin-antitoxin module
MEFKNVKMEIRYSLLNERIYHHPYFTLLDSNGKAVGIVQYKKEKKNGIQKTSFRTKI